MRFMKRVFKVKIFRSATGSNHIQKYKIHLLSVQDRENIIAFMVISLPGLYIRGIQNYNKSKKLPQPPF